MNISLIAARVFARSVLSAMPSGYRMKYAREIAARLSRRAPSRREAYRIDGGMIYLNLAESRMMAMRAIGMYEFEKRALLKTILRPGMTFVDAGANKGDFSLLAVRLVGEQGRVIAFEPEPGNCRDLADSFALNGYRNVTLHQMALSDHDGTAALFLGEKSGFHSLKPELPDRQTGQINVRVARLDSIIAHTAAVDAMKVDVEGGELELLRGAHKVLEANAQMILLVDLHPHLGADLPAIEELLDGLGFRFYAMKRSHEPLEHLPSRPCDIVASRRPLAI